MVAPVSSDFTPYQPSGAALSQARLQSAKDPETAAKEFESVFLTNFLQSMFSGLSTEAPFGGGHAEETWRSMLVKEYADEIVETGGIGIAESVYRELISVQEAANQ